MRKRRFAVRTGNRFDPPDNPGSSRLRKPLRRMQAPAGRLGARAPAATRSVDRSQTVNNWNCSTNKDVMLKIERCRRPGSAKRGQSIDRIPGRITVVAAAEGGGRQRASPVVRQRKGHSAQFMDRGFGCTEMTGGAGCASAAFPIGGLEARVIALGSAAAGFTGRAERHRDRSGGDRGQCQP